jgi:solute carrier family 13 (sodium-dependent dicarboxylate transporter), member 2/3/5
LKSRSALVIPIALAALTYLLLRGSTNLTTAGCGTAAVAVLMAGFWISEAIPIAATSLLPIVIFPVIGAAKVKEATAPYSDPIIYLFMGGLLIALAIQRWDLHKRIALVTVRFFGTSGPRLVAGIMASTAFISMWMSNTAITAMMLPIGMSLIDLMLPKGREATRGERNFSTALMLGIAYAATIGGIGTLVGTPPNMLFAAFWERQYSVPFTFFDWLIVGLPFAVLFLPLTWFFLTKVFFPHPEVQLLEASKWIDDQLHAMGPLQPAEKRVLAVFVLTATLWVLQPLIHRVLPSVDDTVIGVFGALLLFLLPSGNRETPRLLDWETAKKLPWQVLILFGGGLSLASAVERNGIAELMAGQFVRFSSWPLFTMILLTASAAVFLSEFMGNAALVALLMPILASVAKATGTPPIILLVPATIGASAAFMMPAGTPPNAIVFSSGHIRISQMAAVGFALNLLGIFLMTLLVYLVGGSP